MKSKAELYAKVCLMLAWAVLPCALSWQVVYGPARFRGYVDQKLEGVGSWLGTTGDKVTAIIDNTGKVIVQTNQFVEDSYPQSVATSKTTAAAVKHLDDFVVNLNANVNGGEDTEGVTKEGLLLHAQALLDTSQGLIKSIQGDVDDLSKAGVISIGKLNPVLDNLAVLTATLNKQIDQNGDQVKVTMVALEKGLQDLDVILAGDDVKNILSNMSATTYHLTESAKSVDIAFQALRTKMGMIKTVLSKAINLIKVTIPIP